MKLKDLPIGTIVTTSKRPHPNMGFYRVVGYSGTQGVRVEGYTGHVSTEQARSLYPAGPDGPARFEQARQAEQAEQAERDRLSDLSDDALADELGAARQELDDALAVWRPAEQRRKRAGATFDRISFEGHRRVIRIEQDARRAARQEANS